MFIGFCVYYPKNPTTAITRLFSRFSIFPVVAQQFENSFSPILKTSSKFDSKILTLFISPQPPTAADSLSGASKSSTPSPKRSSSRSASKSWTARKSLTWLPETAWGCSAKPISSPPLKDGPHPSAGDTVSSLPTSTSAKFSRMRYSTACATFWWATRSSSKGPWPAECSPARNRQLSFPWSSATPTPALTWNR